MMEDTNISEAFCNFRKGLARRLILAMARSRLYQVVNCSNIYEHQMMYAKVFFEDTTKGLTSLSSSGSTS